MPLVWRKPHFQCHCLYKMSANAPEPDSLSKFLSECLNVREADGEVTMARLDLRLMGHGFREIMHESGRAHRACAQVNHPSTFVNVRNASRQCATIRHASPSVLYAVAFLRQGRALLPFPARNIRKSGVGKIRASSHCVPASPRGRRGDADTA
ncbi:hypothetical protein PO909_001793 [Leuciscus waleckii]